MTAHTDGADGTREPRPRSSWPSRILRIVAGIGALLTVLGFVGSWFWLFDLIANLRVQLIVVAVATVGAEALRPRRPFVLGVATTVLLVNASVVVPLYLGRPQVPSGSRVITVAHLNLQGRPGDFDELLRELDRPDAPDVFVVLEPDLAWQTRARGRSLPLGLVAGSTMETALVFSRVPVQNIGRPPTAGLPRPSIEFTIALPEASVEVLALHTRSPGRPGEGVHRDRELDSVATWRASRSGRILVIGDFNATPWSSAFRSLQDRTGLDDSEQGFGVQASYPATSFVGVPIDHSLHTSDLVTVDRRLGPSFGSGHRSLLVSYALIGAPAPPSG